ncbi:hypothetical protein D3C85_822250 [compost metagenome]
MVGDEARVDLIALDHAKVQRLQQAFAGGAQGEVGFDVHHVPLHVAAFDHGLELAVVGRAVLNHANAARFAEGFGPGLLLRILGGTAPTDEVQAFGCDRTACADHQGQGGEGGGDWVSLQHAVFLDFVVVVEPLCMKVKRVLVGLRICQRP